jgi:hypothetical protein
MFYKQYQGDKFEEDEKGGTRNTQGEIEMHIQFLSKIAHTILSQYYPPIYT